MATVRMSNKLTCDLCKEYEKSYQNTKQNQSTLRLLAMLSMTRMSNLLLTESEKQQNLMM